MGRGSPIGCLRASHACKALVSNPPAGAFWPQANRLYTGEPLKDILFRGSPSEPHPKRVNWLAEKMRSAACNGSGGLFGLALESGLPQPGPREHPAPASNGLASAGWPGTDKSYGFKPKASRLLSRHPVGLRLRSRGLLKEPLEPQLRDLVVPADAFEKHVDHRARVARSEARRSSAEYRREPPDGRMVEPERDHRRGAAGQQAERVGQVDVAELRARRSSPGIEFRVLSARWNWAWAVCLATSRRTDVRTETARR